MKVLYRQTASDDTVRPFRYDLPVLPIAFGSVIGWYAGSLQIQATSEDFAVADCWDTSNLDAVFFLETTDGNVWDELR